MFNKVSSTILVDLELDPQVKLYIVVQMLDGSKIVCYFENWVLSLKDSPNISFDLSFYRTESKLLIVIQMSGWFGIRLDFWKLSVSL